MNLYNGKLESPLGTHNIPVSLFGYTGSISETELSARDIYILDTINTLEYLRPLKNRMG